MQLNLLLQEDGQFWAFGAKKKQLFSIESMLSIEELPNGDDMLEKPDDNLFWVSLKIIEVEVSKGPRDGEHLAVGKEGGGVVLLQWI